MTEAPCQRCQGSGDMDYHGHVTLDDGSHIPLTKDGAAALWHKIEQHEADLAARLPDDAACLDTMCDAYHRLGKLGWSNAIYCPKDGSSFEVIEAGSTGIFRAHYSGKWPDGTWWVEDGGDLWPSRPILWRPIQNAAKPADESAIALCSDCPPIGYPTDKTRCAECPRKTDCHGTGTAPLPGEGGE